MFENIFSSINSENLLKFKENVFKSKKYWISYLVFLAVIVLSIFNINNYQQPFLELIVIGLVSFFGIVIISFFNYHDDKDLYKTAFIIILLFGLLVCFLNPICNVSDEIEHLTRADITSHGILMPDYVNGSFKVSSFVPDFFEKSRALTVLQVSGDTAKINNSMSTYHSAFQQNPFYPYIPQTMGILIAKFLDLNVIWVLWLGRIFNLLFYAFAVSYSVKKSPILKIPLIVTACIPICIQQASSFSIDGMFAGLGFLTVAHFFYYYKSEDFSISNIEIVKFSILCLLLGLCKLSFLGMILLLLCIPSSKFKDRYSKLYILSFIIILGVIGILWSKFIAMPSYTHSWRAEYYKNHIINPPQQTNYILHHPVDFAIAVLHIPNTLLNSSILSEFNTVHSVIPLQTKVYTSGFISAIYPLFIGAIWLIYPKLEKINIFDRIGPFLVLIIIYAGTCILQLISWGMVGHLEDMALHARYFFPLFALIPFIFGFNSVNKKDKKLDLYIICLTIAFLAAFPIKLVALYY